jgi:hypothetical protein
VWLFLGYSKNKKHLQNASGFYYKNSWLKHPGIGVMLVKRLASIGLVADEKEISNDGPFILSTRSQGVLANISITNHEEARKAILENPIKFQRLRGVGEKSFAEICRWCGLDGLIPGPKNKWMFDPYTGKKLK